MKTDKARIYWTVKSAHYGSNRYIFDTLSLAENEIARLKKQYPHEKTELTQLVESSAVEQLEQKVKELEGKNKIIQDMADSALKLANVKLTAAEAREKELENRLSQPIPAIGILQEKLAAQERVIEKQAQELDKLYPLISKICTVSNGLSFYVRNEFNEAKLQSDDQSDLAKRLWDLYNIQCDLEQLTKESK
jgi:uncharacterized coiled-coil protein SlyX